MKYSEMTTDMYVIRTKEISWAKVLSGRIWYVRDVKPKSIVLQATEDCVPKGEMFSLDLNGDDGNWRDVTVLVLEANSAVLPPDNETTYSNDTASSYRNYLGLDNLKPYVGAEAENKLCFLGEVGPDGTIKFSKQGYFVVAYDSGCYIAYQGFCSFVAVDECRKISLGVYVLPSNRAFYPAAEVISACEKAFSEDIAIMTHYTSNIMDSAVADASELSVFDGTGIQRLKLDGSEN